MAQSIPSVAISPTPPPPLHHPRPSPGICRVFLIFVLEKLQMPDCGA